MREGRSNPPFQGETQDAQVTSRYGGHGGQGGRRDGKVGSCGAKHGGLSVLETLMKVQMEELKEETRGLALCMQLVVPSPLNMRFHSGWMFPNPRSLVARDAKELDNFMWHMERYFEGLNMHDEAKGGSFFNFMDGLQLWHLELQRREYKTSPPPHHRSKLSWIIGMITEGSHGGQSHNFIKREAMRLGLKFERQPKDREYRGKTMDGDTETWARSLKRSKTPHRPKLPKELPPNGEVDQLEGKFYKHYGSIEACHDTKGIRHPKNNLDSHTIVVNHKGGVHPLSKLSNGTKHADLGTTRKTTKRMDPQGNTMLKTLCSKETTERQAFMTRNDLEENHPSHEYFVRKGRPVKQVWNPQLHIGNLDYLKGSISSKRMFSSTFLHLGEACGVLRCV
ncbi:hypothetical protein FNV43_RR19102 [Rhamnella rubrinervis]|uniref:Uncharacterized protein n=1 Tax=Rhamnella rubrinervis TaxID=2594499 RepID=A0A8K0GWM6_9ROSA|nr:hypothetical protein FNV43_RR19102 [Rhamnella rubrinervis]